MAPELVAGVGYGDLIREKPYCAPGPTTRRDLRGDPTWSQPGAHGSLEGVGGLKTNEAYHSKADALLIPEM